jgi:hypothetical protein
MKTRIFIATFLLVAICGITSMVFAANPVGTRLEQHDADMTADHLILESKIDSLSSSTTPSVLQPVQGKYSVVIDSGEIGDVISIEAGRYTVPSGKTLIVERITLNVRDGFARDQTFYIFATTSIGSNTVKHSIGKIVVELDSRTDAAPIAGTVDSFQQTLYADQGTDIIFTVVKKSVVTSYNTIIDVTFSGRLIDVP